MQIMKKNDAWWNWSFKRQYSSATEGFASGITDGKTLKNACKKAYLAGNSVDASTKTVTNDSSKYLEEDIWKFCSVGIEKPKTLDEATQGNKNAEEKAKLNGDWKDKIGEKNKTTLLSIDHPENEWIWDLRQKEFEGEGNTTETNKFFSKPSSDSVIHIKDKCRQAFAKDNDGTTSDANTPTKSETIKWCSLSGK